LRKLLSNEDIVQAAQSIKSNAVAEIEGQDFLIFRLDAEEFGIDIRKVQEIRGSPK
jgi:chemotaxis signal transduction protein